MRVRCCKLHATGLHRIFPCSVLGSVSSVCLTWGVFCDAMWCTLEKFKFFCFLKKNDLKGADVARWEGITLTVCGSCPRLNGFRQNTNFAASRNCKWQQHTWHTLDYDGIHWVLFVFMFYLSAAMYFYNLYCFHHGLFYLHKIPVFICLI